MYLVPSAFQIYKGECLKLALNKGFKNDFIFYFFIWVLWLFQEYFTYIEPIVHQRWAKTGKPG